VAEPVTVAVLNTNDDVVEMLRVALEHAGFVVVSNHVDAIRRGRRSLHEFVIEHDPQVVIYDLVPPYDRNWRFFEHLRSRPSMQGRHFIVTSTNATAARELSGGAGDIYEIIGKPFDLEALVDAVGRAAGTEP
jgi:CheY-like chemotaxis protein